MNLYSLIHPYRQGKSGADQVGGSPAVPRNLSLHPSPGPWVFPSHGFRYKSHRKAGESWDEGKMISKMILPVDQRNASTTQLVPKIGGCRAPRPAGNACCRAGGGAGLS